MTEHRIGTQEEWQAERDPRPLPWLAGQGGIDVVEIGLRERLQRNRVAGLPGESLVEINCTAAVVRDGKREA